MNQVTLDHMHMAHALRLAERGLYTTQPNPRVGCVVAHGEEVVGEGWHVHAGEAHAEVLALRAAGVCAHGATVYVTLEPCGLQGRTPPCVDALIAAGIARVVIASEDASQHAGDALARLRKAGIEVETGLMRETARGLNRGFFSRIERDRPWLRLKLAMSLDGRTALANGASKWITGAAARADVQRWRARSSAILTGIGSVLADDPRLTARIDETHIAPLRVVLDRDLRTPAGAHLLDGSVPTLVFHAQGSTPQDGRFDHVECLASASDAAGLELRTVLRVLAERGCNEVQVEAGPRLAGAWLAAGLVDELLLYIAPVLLGDAAQPLLALPRLDDLAARWRMQVVEQGQVGEDWRLLLRPQA